MVILYQSELMNTVVKWSNNDIHQEGIKTSNKIQKSKLHLRSKMGAVVGVITF